jgi:NAD(P)H-quinone oxidoreductase subunit 5
MQQNQKFVHINEINESNTLNSPLISRIASPILWIVFLCALGITVFYSIEKPTWNFSELFRINGFTLLIWTTVLFFNAVLSTYSKNYLSGFKYHKRFTLLSQGFALAVIVFVMSNHIVPLLISWICMSFFMAQLIGINKDWGEARAAYRYTSRFFYAGGLLFSAGVLMLSYYTDSFLLSNILERLEDLPYSVLLFCALLIITAAIIQSAIYPFHRWLLSAMTAPTPASALMHAGFVNGAGILLTLFSTLLIFADAMTLIFIIGGLTAILAQFTKLIQVNVKQKLACSTIAQMGFMVMQCGLGFFNAAVAHLILHGFYKAYLFLSTGEEVLRSSPKTSPKLKIKPLQAIAVLLFGLFGAGFFMYLTGKTNYTDSSIFLTLVVAITVGQATYNIVKETSITYLEKIGLSAVLFIVGIGVYALFYKMVTALMFEMPMIENPQPLSVLQIAFGLIFLVGFFFMKLSYYRQTPWLYVKLLNMSQPYKKTVFSYKKQTK